jgi:surface polysaccharide O-acyltransferase-like enzyme
MSSQIEEQIARASVATDGIPIQTPSKVTSNSRLFFVDHLRVALILLVVLHHLAVIYGASALFYYLEPPKNDPLASLVLLGFVLINQAYFMGFFFLISGYFTPGSFDRKGSNSFLKDRLLRLGIPLLFFMFILGPIASFGLYYWTPIKTSFIGLYPYLVGVGPLWFVEMLLIFDFGYVVWRWATRNHTWDAEREVRPPNYLEIGIFALALALVSYLFRIVIPMGMSVPILGFPTPAYIPQYLSFFILGTLAFRRDWFRTIPNSMGKVGFGVALIATIILLPLALSGGAHFLGKGYWQSAAYALWDSTFAVGMCLALITFFRHFLNRTGKFSRFLSRNTYTVYLIHAPLIVFLAIALRLFHPEQLIKFGVAALIGLPLCFLVANLVRKIPLVSRIL